MKLIFLLFIISCGKNQDGFIRCYTKEEALNHCIVTRIGQTGESSYLASIYCAPRFQAQACYSLGGL
jgi:hypothetical protein